MIYTVLIFIFISDAWIWHLFREEKMMKFRKLMLMINIIYCSLFSIFCFVGNDCCWTQIDSWMCHFFHPPPLQIFLPKRFYVKKSDLIYFPCQRFSFLSYLFNFFLPNVVNLSSSFKNELVVCSWNVCVFWMQTIYYSSIHYHCHEIFI